MKTSNKLLVAATLILIAYFVVYDLSLKAEYLKGDYKKRFYAMNQVSLANFDRIENNAANTCTVNIEHGDKFEVWTNDDAKAGLGITKRNNTLSIDYVKYKDEDYHSYQVFIICPDLKAVSTGYKSIIAFQNGGGVTTITGFKLDKVALKVSNNTLIALSNNTINQLDAVVKSGLLTITTDNKINTGNFDIKDDGRFTLLDPYIGKANYHFADNATISLTGRPLKLFKR